MPSKRNERRPTDQTKPRVDLSGPVGAETYQVAGLNKGVAAVVCLLWFAGPAVPWATGIAVGLPGHLVLWLVAAIGIVTAWRSAAARWLVRLYADGMLVTDRHGRESTVLYRDVHWVQAHSGGQLGFTLHMCRGDVSSFYLPPSLPYGHILPRIDACPESYGGPVPVTPYAHVPDAGLSPAISPLPATNQPRALSPADPPDQLTESEDA